MMMFHLVLGCGSLNLHQVWLYSVHLLVWVVYHLVSCICVLALLSLAGSRHYCTVGLGLSTVLKVLHHLAVSSTPSVGSNVVLVVFLFPFKWLPEGIYYESQRHLVWFCIIFSVFGGKCL